VPDSLLDRRLILVVGKGGVGRSTVAAALAARSAAAGRQTLLFEANANDRWGEMFGAKEVDAEIRRLENNLYAVNTNPEAALEEYGLMVLRFRRVYNMVFENRLVKGFIHAVPGMEDYSVLGKVWYHTTETRRGRPVWDTTIFDMPASGHSLSMLRIPRVILDAVPEGPLTRDARSLSDLLHDRDRTAVVLVTLAEEMPVNEATELTERLDSELGIAVDRLVVNQVVPDRFPPGSTNRAVLDALGEATPGDPELAAIAAHAAATAARRDLQRVYIDRLAAAIDAPRIELPALFVDSIGRAELDELGEKLA
jgi:anion-transporting  ArsA/GET3 family ATPase